MSALLQLIPFLRGYAFNFTETISADFTNYNLRTRVLAAGWDGVTPVIADVSIASGIVVSADNTSIYGFDTGTGFPAGSSLALNYPSAYICGMGGAGGSYGAAGSAGGPALRIDSSIPATINAGTTAGGGGGGGGGGGFGGGGGGRTGRTASSAGAGGSPAAVAGSFTSGGKGANSAGGAGGTTAAGTNGGFSSGGGGGGWGAAGGSGYSGGAGGAGGAAVVGNAYITWTNTGTRYGSIT